MPVRNAGGSGRSGCSARSPVGRSLRRESCLRASTTQGSPESGTVVHRRVWRTAPVGFAFCPDAAPSGGPDKALASRPWGWAGSRGRPRNVDAPAPDGVERTWTDQAGESSVVLAGVRFGFRARAIEGWRPGSSGRTPMARGDALLRHPPALSAGAATCCMSTSIGGRSCRSIRWGRLRTRAPVRAGQPSPDRLAERALGRKRLIAVRP